MKTGKKWIRAAASLKFAVIIILVLAGALIAGTFLESSADARTAQYYIYQAKWFHVFLVFLGLNIAAVMVDRWPWKKRHLPFLLAHIGILVLLFGSWITYRWGLDGLLRVEEGYSSGGVEIQEELLYFSKDTPNQETAAWVVPVRWRPKRELFKPFQIKIPGWNEPAQISDFIPYAEEHSEWLIEESPRAHRAVEIKIEGGPMAIQSTFWLSNQDFSTRFHQAGPALFQWVEAGQENQSVSLPTVPLLVRFFAADDSVQVVRLKDGKTETAKRQKLVLGQPVLGVLQGGVSLTLLKTGKAFRETSYRVPRFLQGNRRFYQSAIQVQFGDESLWLGLGDRATLRIADGSLVEMSYLSKRVNLPFSLKLDLFHIDHNPGTRDPASYWSRVWVPNQNDPVVISMNEPLKHGGYTFYQSSYENAHPRPTVSIFSVNQDPGRVLKYLGSILLVLGICVLFYEKSKNKKEN